MATNFTDGEFRRASQREPTPAELAKLPQLRAYLEELRRRASAKAGRDVPLRITSWVRTHKPGTARADRGTHSTGDAVDVVPMYGRLSMAQLGQLAADVAQEQGVPKVLNEHNHIHVAWRLLEGQRAGYMVQESGGGFRLAQAFERLKTPKGYGSALLLVLGLGLAARL